MSKRHRHPPADLMRLGIVLEERVRAPIVAGDPMGLLFAFKIMVLRSVVIRGGSRLAATCSTRLEERESVKAL